ncbi:MAG: isoprenylcysteine carboxylmethyltransferase family protein [Haliscomenobacter sp.]|nr:isoprenylcysteine carboxylmethyltransferase family protein [Haliscomenobacter sp.]MBK9488550.1 isoprenylcysteine carboxylmethyltransferase family protein [Haliscomenobacter sp.]
MKSKVISIVVFVTLSYLIPLIGNGRLLFTPQIIMLIFIAIVLFITQPPFTIEDTQKNKTGDKLSVIGILLGCVVCQAFSVVEWAYFQDTPFFKLNYFTGLGLGLLLGGTVFRVWCIQTLGRYFTATVQTQSQQRIITRGAYQFVRHPSYLGAYLAIVGSSVLLQAYYGIVVSVIIMFAVYYYRIKVEEEALVKVFGDEYLEYQQRTKRMVPFIY